jgi:formylglycine-generating enzyme required for sulfatase activity
VSCQRGPSSAGTVIIETKPSPGAEVIIGSTNFGRTPATIRTLPAGQYYAILNQYGYKRATEVIDVPDSGEVRITVEMDPIVGYLTIETVPPGAQVYLDGTVHLGTSPIVSARVPTGHHTYEIRHQSYLTLEGAVDVKADYSYTKLHELQPLKGWLQVFSRPSGAQIFINDVVQQEVTPASFQVAPGLYTVGTYLKDYLPAEKNVTVEPNREHPVDLPMEAGFMPPGMVLVPASEFIMGVDGGAPDERPKRKVQLPAFYIDKFEVTNRDFAAVFSNHRFDERAAMMPVTGVSWTRATAYADAVGKRLPTEAEWEKAARGTDGREYPWGNTFDPDFCTANTSPRSAPTRVGSFRQGASPFGAMDMAGNIYEWTSSWYQPYEGNTLVKDDYGQLFRVLRGGSYTTDRFGVRTARRHYDKPDSTREDYGFRCAMDAIPAGAGPPQGGRTTPNR